MRRFELLFDMDNAKRNNPKVCPLSMRPLEDVFVTASAAEVYINPEEEVGVIVDRAIKEGDRVAISAMQQYRRQEVNQDSDNPRKEVSFGFVSIDANVSEPSITISQDSILNEPSTFLMSQPQDAKCEPYSQAEGESSNVALLELAPKDLEPQWPGVLVDETPSRVISPSSCEAISINLGVLRS